MVTAGLDSYIKIWDLRTYSCLHSYCTSQPATSLDISDTNLLAMTVNRSVEVLKDAFTKPSELTYLRHTIRTPNASLSSGGGVTASTRFLASSIQAVCVKFRPYEDVLAVGHTHGLSTVIVPGELTILPRTAMLLFFSLKILFQSLSHFYLPYPLLLSCHIYFLCLLGAGEANFDSYENNPFQNPKQRQEQEVQTLLQKLSHEMIGLDSSFVGTLDKGQ